MPNLLHLPTTVEKTEAVDDAFLRSYASRLSIGHVELARHIRRAQASRTARADIGPEVTAG